MKRSNVIRYQTGAALLLMAAAMIIVASLLSYQLMGGLGAKLKRQNAQEVSQVLADAKENLLVFAESIPEIYAGTNSKQSPGFLLCPDMHALIDPLSGFSSGSCSWATSNAIGRFPTSKAANPGANQYFYFSLSESQTGQSIWYAIAPEVQYGATGTTSNYVTNKNPVYDVTSPSLILDGNGVAAVIIAAGDPIGNQVRDKTQIASLQWNQYLESASGGASGASFLSTPINANQFYNDRVVGIPWATFQSRMKARVCSLAKSNNWCLNASNYNGSGWFNQFNWGFNSETSAAQICTGTPTTPTGINVTECP